MNTQEKISVLSDASRFDLSCACGHGKASDQRKRTKEGAWLYPVSAANGGNSIVFKTLLSNVCENNCSYCPYRKSRDIQRLTLTPDEIAKSFADFAASHYIYGLFVSSGVIKNPDYTMDRIIATARILRRKYKYRGYLHLKIIPGASREAIDTALSLSSAVSLNVEVPTASSFKLLSAEKDYYADIVNPIKYISEVTSPGNKYSRVRTTTQFVVGASDEKDTDIVNATYGLYKKMQLNRVYFSAYQRGLGDAVLPGEKEDPQILLTREHRLYQADFLIRKYKWDVKDFIFRENGNFSMEFDPKKEWADRHPEFFPVRLLKADYESLLRVPGIGLITANRIIENRKYGTIRDLKDVGVKNKRLDEISKYAILE